MDTNGHQTTSETVDNVNIQILYFNTHIYATKPLKTLSSE